MNELETRMRIHALTENMLQNFMSSNGINATQMIDALNAVLVKLYPISITEMLQSIDAQRQQAQQLAEQNQEESPTEEKDVE